MFTSLQHSLIYFWDNWKKKKMIEFNISSENCWGKRERDRGSEATVGIISQWLARENKNQISRILTKTSPVPAPGKDMPSKKTKWTSQHQKTLTDRPFLLTGGLTQTQSLGSRKSSDPHLDVVGVCCLLEPESEIRFQCKHSLVGWRKCPSQEWSSTTLTQLRVRSERLFIKYQIE